MRRNFFTSASARAVGFLGFLIAVIAVVEFGYLMHNDPVGSAWFSLRILPHAAIFLVLSLVIDYLARITAALEKRGAPGRAEDAA